jgi:hypothetical protein
MLTQSASVCNDDVRQGGMWCATLSDEWKIEEL